jgi:hypothetical protein
MQYRDIVIHTNTGTFGKQDHMDQFPPVQQRVDLSEHIWLGRIDDATAKLVMDTCEPKIVGLAPPTRQFAQLYGFVRELPDDSVFYQWDHDGELSTVVSLSRLIHLLLSDLITQPGSAMRRTA